MIAETLNDREPISEAETAGNGSTNNHKEHPDPASGFNGVNVEHRTPNAERSTLNAQRSTLNSSPFVTIEELMAVTGESERHLRRRGLAGDFGPSARNGSHLYQLDTIPKTLRGKLEARREAIRAKEARETLAEESPALDGQRCPWSLLDLTDKQRADARARADLVLWVSRRKRERACNDEQAIGAALWWARENAEVCPFAPLLTAGKNDHHQFSLGNLWRWRGQWNRYRRGEFDDDQWWSLADRPNTARKPLEGDARYWDRIRLLYEFVDGPALVDCWRKSAEEGEKKGWGEAPSYRQVKYYYARKADRAAVKARRLGDKFIYNNLDTTARRDWSAVPFSGMWCSDHHEFNDFVRIRAPHAPGYWIAVRPWLTQMLDVPTMHEVASTIRGRAPDGDVILSTWRDAVEQLGFCAETIYFDNGKDYRSIGGKAGRFRPTPLDDQKCLTAAQILGTRAIFALPFNARAKPCEMDFGLWVSKFEKQWPTFCGHNTEMHNLLWPGLKRERLETFTGDNNPLRGCLVNPDLVPTLEEFTAAYRRWRVEEREKATSDGIMLDGKSPEQAWQIGMASHTRPKLSPETIFLAFLRSFAKPQKVDRGAVVWLRRGESKRDWIRYHSRALEPWLISGEEVLVKVDVNDISQAYVFEWVKDHGWRLIHCGGPRGGCPSLADIHPMTGMDAVRDVTKGNRSRRKTIRQGVDAEEQQRALEELRWRGGERQATETEALLGATPARAYRLDPGKALEQSKERKERTSVADAFLDENTNKDLERAYLFGNGNGNGENQKQPTSGGQDGDNDDGRDSGEPR